MKTKNIFLTAALIAVSFTTFAQVGIGTTDPKAGLDITSDKGMLLPRMADHTTLVPVDGTLDANEAGLQVYNTTTNKVMLFDGTNWVESTGGETKWEDIPLTDSRTFAISPSNFNTATDTITFYKKNNVTLEVSSSDKVAQITVESKDFVAAVGVDAKIYSAVQVFGAGSNQVRLLGYNGDTDNKTALTNNKIIGYLAYSGYNGSAFSGASSSILARSTQNFNPTGYGSQLEFSTTQNNTITSQTRMVISQSGNVGIGVAAPTSLLEVGGNISSKSASGQATISVDAAAGTHPTYALSEAGTAKWAIQSNPNNNDVLRFWSRVDNNQDVLVLQQNGNVAIGTTVATTKLDVNGTIKVGDSNDATPSNGMIRYNSTDNKFQGYANGAWVDLH